MNLEGCSKKSSGFGIFLHSSCYHSHFLGPKISMWAIPFSSRVRANWSRPKWAYNTSYFETNKAIKQTPSLQPSSVLKENEGIEILGVSYYFLVASFSVPSSFLPYKLRMNLHFTFWVNTNVFCYCWNPTSYCYDANNLHQIWSISYVEVYGLAICRWEVKYVGYMAKCERNPHP